MINSPTRPQENMNLKIASCSGASSGNFAVSLRGCRGTQTCVRLPVVLRHLAVTSLFRLGGAGGLRPPAGARGVLAKSFFSFIVVIVTKEKCNVTNSHR